MSAHPAEERLSVVCDGLRLAGGAVLPAEPHGLVVLFHGIPSVAPPDPGDTGYPGLARRFGAEGWAAAWADMRAVRGSPGNFSIEGWVRDARAIVDAARLLDHASSLPIALVGSSAGGAVAIEAIKRGAPADALVLLATPAAWLSFAHDPAEAVRRITEEAGMPVAAETLADPAAWAKEFESVVAERSIGSIGVPTLVVHSSDDDVVPVDHGRRIAERARNADLQIVDGGGHQLRRDDRVLRLVLDWLARALR